jgi:hypothetical protein
MYGFQGFGLLTLALPKRGPNAYRNAARRWTFLLVEHPLAGAVEDLREVLGVAVDQRAPHGCLDLGLRGTRTNQRPAEILLILASRRSRPAAAPAASDCA